MSNDLARKAALLIGLSISMGGICDANAATTTPVTETFFVFAATGVDQATDTLQFPQFNPSLGTLTSVDFSLSSSISGAAFLSAEVATGGVLLVEQLNTGNPTPFDFTNQNGLFPPLGLTTAFYTGSGNIDVDLTLNSSGAGPGGVAWSGSENFTGLTLVYDYTPAATPLPAALPLFATGIGALGLLGLRRKRKSQAVAA
jgi:hypothetical protein